MATQPAVFQQSLDPESSYWQTMMKRYQEQMNQPVQQRFTPEQIEQRKGANAQQEQMGMLAMLSGDPTLQNLGGTIFKQSLEGRKAQVGTKGVYDPITQTWTRDPNIQREDLQENLRRAEEGYARAQTQAQLETQRAADRRELKAYGASLKGGGSTVGAQGTNPDGSITLPSKGTMSAWSVTPEGNTVGYHSTIGPVEIRQGPDGNPRYFPYFGTSAQPRAGFEKQVLGAQELQSKVQTIDALESQVTKNPKAFSVQADIYHATPRALQGAAAQQFGLSQDDLAVRANFMRQAAQEMHDLYGAAQTAGEEARGRTFLVDPNDSVMQVRAKLQAGRSWAEQKRTGQPSAAANAAIARSGGPSPGAAPPPPPAPTTGRRKSDEGFSATIRSP